MNYHKAVESGMPKEQVERARHLSQPMTTKENRSRRSYGSMLFDIPSRGCPAPLCIKGAEHPPPHWPIPKEA